MKVRKHCKEKKMYKLNEKNVRGKKGLNEKKKI
jgi:hypothetical protein